MKSKENDFREKVNSTFLKIAKKNKWLKIPALFCMTVVLSFYYILRHFSENGKRYAGIGFVLVFFMLSSSFAFPVVADGGSFVSTNPKEETNAAQVTEAAEESGAVLAQEPRTEDRQPVDDQEILDGYEGAELEGTTAADQYTLDELLEASGKYDSGRDPQTEADGKRTADFEADDWRLVLINKQHPIPENYELDLVTIKGNMQCDKRILNELLAMLQAAKADGVNLVIRSPYRDMDRQEYLFDRKITKYMSNGMSYMEAYKTASQAVTVPGASEHQIGLAIDITSDDYASLDEEFGKTAAGKWLAEHGCEYGFILRYPEGKEYITSIEYEPWHFRYVGVEAATVIMENGITLEEFTEDYL